MDIMDMDINQLIVRQNKAGRSSVPLGGPSVSRMTMAWTTRMCIVAVSPVVQRRNTWSWDSDY